MKNLLHSLGRRQRADKKEECLPRGSAGEKQNRFFPFLCNVKMVGEEIIRLARSEGKKTAKEKKKIDERGEKINVFTRFICDKVLLGSLI